MQPLHIQEALLPIEIDSLSFKYGIRVALAQGFHLSHLLLHVEQNLSRLLETARSCALSPHEETYTQAVLSYHTLERWVAFTLEVCQEKKPLSKEQSATVEPLHAMLKAIQDHLQQALPHILEQQCKRYEHLLNTLQSGIRQMHHQSRSLLTRVKERYRSIPDQKQQEVETVLAEFFAQFVQEAPPLATLIMTHLKQWCQQSLSSGRDLCITTPGMSTHCILFSLKGTCYPVLEQGGHLLGIGSDKKVFRTLALPKAQICAISRAFALPASLDSSETQERDTDRFMGLWQETQFLTALRDKPGVISIQERMAFSQGASQQLFVVTPYFWEGSLKEYFRHTLKSPEAIGRFSASTERALISQLLEGLCHIHEAGIIHHDLKPDNILLDLSGETPRAVIADFHLAAWAADTQRLRHLRCRAAWAPPEQACWALGKSTEPHTTPALDLWSLGVVLYMLTTLSLPPWLTELTYEEETKPGNLQTPNAFKEKIDRPIFERLSSLGPDWFPSSLNTHPYAPLLKRLLATHPEKRGTAVEAQALFQTLAKD